MAEFVSSFITGFQDVVKNDLPKRLKNLKIINIFDGLVHYSYAGNSRDLDKIFYFNNTFFVLKIMKGKGLNFPSLVGAVGQENKYYLINKGTFRVRFVQENQFAKVDKNIAKRAEETVLRNSKLQLDRLSPSTEIWYSIRREGFAFCGQLLSKREFTEKNLNKGELRPEIAYFMCCYSDMENFYELNSTYPVIAEPFCGYGAIPVQIIKKFRFEKLYISDIDAEKIALLREKKQFKENPSAKDKENKDKINIEKINTENKTVDIRKENAFELNQITDKSVDIVITDPPWGFYEDIGDVKTFYNKMFKSFERILKKDGRMIILTARKTELEEVVTEKSYKIIDSLHTLVNGKKAGIYKISF